jgi:16S rRNA (guanine527-N7)-methyltransferase
LSRRRSEPVDLIVAALEATTGRAPGAAERQQFNRYLDLFLRWNRTQRMTSLGSPEAIARELIADSLLFLPLLPSGRPLSVVDLGAGAGIPGLPLRLADPRLALTLVEARRKRVSFLRAACRELGLDDVIVLEGRAEDLLDREPSLAQGVDVVVARAVGPATALLDVARKYLKPMGLFLASGPPRPTPQAGVEIVRQPIPWTGGTRTFLRALKES